MRRSYLALYAGVKLNRISIWIGQSSSVPVAPEFRADVDAIISRALADFYVAVAELRELRKRDI